MFVERRLTQTWLLDVQRNHSNCEGERGMRRIAALTTQPGHDRAGRGACHRRLRLQEDARTAPPTSASAARARRRPARRRTSPSMSATASSSTPTPRRSAPTRRQTLARQAQWLNQYPQLRHHRRRPCRRARHPRIQSGARRPPRRRHPRLPGRPGRSGQPPEDDLLRQGTAGRRLRRHLLLVAEPPRRHRARRRRQLIADGTSATVREKAAHRAAFLLVGRACKQNLAEVSQPAKTTSAGAPIAS